MPKNGASGHFFKNILHKREFRYDLKCADLRSLKIHQLHCVNELLKSWVRAECLGTYLAHRLKKLSRRKISQLNYFQ